MCRELKVHSSMNSDPEYSWRFWDAIFRKHEICPYTVHSVCTVLVFVFGSFILGKTFTETIFTLSNIKGRGQLNHRPPILKRLGGKMSFTWIWWMAAPSTSHFTLKVNYFRWYHRHKLKPCSFCSHTQRKESNHPLDIKFSFRTGWSKPAEQRQCYYMQ